MIKEYFANYFLHTSDVTFDLRRERDRGPRHARPSLARDPRRHRRGYDDRRPAQARRATTSRTRRFCFTYGDGVARHRHRARSIAFHRAHGKLATVTAVRPPGRFGALDDRRRPRDATSARSPRATAAGSTAASSSSRRACSTTSTATRPCWEREPLERLARDGELMAYRHAASGSRMDTLRDKTMLEELWASGKAPWKVW